MSKNFEIVGIAANSEDAAIETKPGKGPQKDLTMCKLDLVSKSNGKLFLALRDFDPTKNNAMKMYFNGEQVKIRKNENVMFTDSAQQKENRYLPYPFDVPMRYLDNVTFPQTYTIKFEIGTYTGSNEFVKEGESDTFTLTITE